MRSEELLMEEVTTVSVATIYTMTLLVIITTTVHIPVMRKIFYVMCDDGTCNI